jgi:hypothetical protein
MKTDFQELEHNWEAAMAANDAKQAVLAAAKAYVLAAQTDDAKKERVFLGMLYIAVQKVAGAQIERSPADTCSFCHREGISDRCVRGAGVQICDSCVATAHESLGLSGSRRR